PRGPADEGPLSTRATSPTVGRSASRRRLVLLSVPYARLHRVLLGEPVLGLLRRSCDVAIISPLADEPAFQSEFGAAGTHFVRVAPFAADSRRLGVVLFGVSELLRSLGFWQRFARRGMRYFLRTQDVRFGKDGADTPQSLRYRL